MRCFVALALIFCSSTTTAAAQEATASADLDEAHRAIDEADFGAATIALDHATVSAMTRDELLRWLELHSLLAFADGRLGALEEALQGYASLLGDAAPPAAFPRPLRERVTELASSGARIVVRAEPAVTTSSDVRTLAMPTTVIDDPGHLVRRIEVRVQIDDADPITLAPGETTTIPGDVHRDVELAWTLTVVGPGGAVLEETAETADTLAGVPLNSDDALIAGIVTGAVVLVGVAAVLAWGATDNWWRGSVTSVHGALVTF